MQIESASETDTALREWGNWARERQGPKLNELHLIKTTYGTYSISDEYACLIDSFVAELLEKHKRWGRCVNLTYRHRYTTRMLGERFNCSQNSARMDLQAGVSWIDAMLHGSESINKRATIGL